MNLASFGSSAKSVIAALAPTIGTAIGGPFGALAGNVLAKFLGTSDPKEMETAITSNDPDTLLKLKQAENEFQEHIKTLQISEEQLVVADKADARARDIAVRDNTPSLMGWLIVGASIALGMAAISGWITKDPSQASLVGTVIGYVFSEAKEVISFFFGSSAGELSKSNTLDSIAAKK